jgi:2',3'-cyclic-nucleotide 2'-phosphodiesterase (5'-nucleotidase family)
LDSLAGKNLLVLDSGNALFANAGAATEADKARARFVFGVMERLGTRVMAVGQRDLSAGLPFLEFLAKGSKLKLLSANLEKNGKRVFDASTVVDAGGVKVAIIGLTAPGPVVPDAKDVTSTGTLAAAKKALQGLGPRDLTIVLAATSYADSMQLSQELQGQVDFVIQSGEYRGAQMAQRLDERSALLFASAQKGQALAKVEVNFGTGKGPFFDLSVVDRDQQQLDFLDAQVKTLDERLKLAKDKSATADLKRTLGDLQKRRAELKASIARQTGASSRTVKLEWVTLGSNVKDDEALKAEVLKIDPSYSGSH